MLALSAAFTSGGATMIRDSQSMGWFVMVFFGLCTLIALILLLPNSSYLSRSPARPPLQHRLILNYRAEAEGIRAGDLVDRLLATVTP